MATGGAGPVAIAESVYRGTSYGNHPLVAAAGPIAQLAVDVAMLEANLVDSYQLPTNIRSSVSW